MFSPLPNLTLMRAVAGATVDTGRESENQKMRRDNKLFSLTF